jgi:hypothetical protein
MGDKQVIYVVFQCLGVDLCRVRASKEGRVHHFQTFDASRFVMLVSNMVGRDEKRKRPAQVDFEIGVGKRRGLFQEMEGESVCEKKSETS